MGQGDFRKRIDRLLEQLTQLAESSLPTEEFYAQFLRHLHNEMSAVASAIWRLTKAGRFTLESQIDLLQATLDLDHARVVDRQNILRRAIEHAEPTMVKQPATSAGNHATCTMLLAPMRLRGRVVGLVEIWVEPDRDSGEQRDMLHFLSVAASVCACGMQGATVNLEIERKRMNRLVREEGDVLENSRKHINRLLEEIARLSESDLPAEEFYVQFLKHLHNSITGAASAIWLIPSPGHLNLQHQINLPQAGMDVNDPRVQSHVQMLRQVAAQSPPQPKIIAPQQAALNSPSYGEFTFLVAPILLEKQVAGLVEVWVRSQRHPDAQRGFLHFLVIAANLCAGFIRRNRHEAERLD